MWHPPSGLSGIPRLAWISGSEPPPAVSTPITRLLCRVSGLPRLARLPLRRAFGFHLYTAAQGGSPFYSVMMADDLSVTRCGFQRSRCVGFWCHRASLALPPGKPPAALGVSPLTVFIIAPSRCFVKHFFYFFALFFGRPFGLPLYRGLSLLRGFATRSTNREWERALGGTLENLQCFDYLGFHLRCRSPVSLRCL